MINQIYKFVQQEHVVSAQSVANKFHISLVKAKELLNILDMQGVFATVEKTTTTACNSSCGSCSHAKFCR